MKILETLLARVVVFADVRRVNPNGLAIGPVHAGLLKRYKFLIYPINPGDFDFTKGIKYSDGEFIYNGQSIAVALSIFTDGWAVESLVSTEATDAFWNDFAGWLETLGFRGTKALVSRRIYESQLVVQSPVDIARQLGKLQSIATLIRALSEDQKDQTVTGFYIGADNEQVSRFTFERRQGVPFSEDKYFSRASLTTSNHILALKELETLLS
jgi:hypothetical protein